MKEFVCNVCGFKILEEILPEKCPDCGVSKEYFKEKEELEDHEELDSDIDL